MSYIYNITICLINYLYTITSYIHQSQNRNIILIAQEPYTIFSYYSDFTSKSLFIKFVYYSILGIIYDINDIIKR